MGDNKKLLNLHEQKFGELEATATHFQIFQNTTNSSLKNLETQVGQLAINIVPVAFNHKRTTCICPTTKLASFLFKEKTLSQASLELSSSRGVFGSQENKGKRREKREHQTLTKATRLYLQK